MDKITETSAKRLIVLDCIDFLASQMFGDKYTYSMHVVAHDPLEELTKLEQPIWNTILGDESSELFDMGKTIANDILINVHITAPVPSTNIAHAIPYLEDIGKMLATEVFGKAYAMLMEEIVNFIPDPERQKMFQNLLFLAGGNQAAVLAEANRILESKKTALTAQTIRIIDDRMETAWAPVTKALTEAAGDGGTTNSSKSAANLESIQEN